MKYISPFFKSAGLMYCLRIVESTVYQRKIQSKYLKLFFFRELIFIEDFYAGIIGTKNITLYGEHSHWYMILQTELHIYFGHFFRNSSCMVAAIFISGVSQPIVPLLIFLRSFADKVPPEMLLLFTLHLREKMSTNKFFFKNTLYTCFFTPLPPLRLIYQL